MYHECDSWTWDAWLQIAKAKVSLQRQQQVEYMFEYDTFKYIFFVLYACV